MDIKDYNIKSVNILTTHIMKVKEYKHSKPEEVFGYRVENIGFYSLFDDVFCYDFELKARFYSTEFERIQGSGEKLVLRPKRRWRK